MPVFEDLPAVVIAPMEDTVTRRPTDPGRSERPTEDEGLDEPAPPPASSEPPNGGRATEEEPGESAAAQEPDEVDVGEDVEATPDAELEAQAWLEELAAEGEEEVPSTGDVLSVAVAEVVEQMHGEDEWDGAEEPRTREARVSAPRSPAPAGRLPARRVVVIDDDPDDGLATSREEAGTIRDTPDRTGNGDRRDTDDGGSDGIGARLQNEAPPPKRRWRLFRKGGE
jgi:hypothetical protein